MTISELGKILFIAGLIIAIAGLILILAGKVQIPWFGRLPGDFSYKGENFSFYFPLATSLLISVILTLILWLINRR
jgi:hypothetical protein